MLNRTLFFCQLLSPQWGSLLQDQPSPGSSSGRRSQPQSILQGHASGTMAVLPGEPPWLSCQFSGFSRSITYQGTWGGGNKCVAIELAEFPESRRLSRAVGYMGCGLLKEVTYTPHHNRGILSRLSLILEKISSPSPALTTSQFFPQNIRVISLKADITFCTYPMRKQHLSGCGKRLLAALIASCTA